MPIDDTVPGTWAVAAADVYVAGAVEGEVYVPGAAAAEVYVAGAIEGEVRPD